ncbi:MAG: PD-(D/E)XK motif protein [Myxococcales bacterium]|nr:PD-(D/E)XK motif protein [Myxococcales bacterium]MCA9639300.1 PD-(D/E)XK motif protein [Myxococcales bacterium]
MNALGEIHALPTPRGKALYSIGPRWTPIARLARSREGFPALLITTSGTGPSSPRRLAQLIYEPARPLEISARKGKRTERLAVIECRAQDESLQQVFFRILAALLDVPARPGIEGLQLEQRIDELVDLFRAVQRPGSSTLQGLWAELAIILWSLDPVTALAAWHSSARALHDFASGAHRLEVKSSLRGLREHHVRMDQLNEMPHGRTLFASILLQAGESGTSLDALLLSIQKRLGRANVEATRRLESIVLLSLGTSWQEGDTARFDLEEAQASLRFYAARDLPRPAQPIPPEVREVAFTLDFSTTPALSLAQARRVDDFFRAMVPPPPRSSLK